MLALLPIEFDVSNMHMGDVINLAPACRQNVSTVLMKADHRNEDAGSARRSPRWRPYPIATWSDRAPAPNSWPGPNRSVWLPDSFQHPGGFYPGAEDGRQSVV
jgi:hypothetical protein